MSHTCYFTHTCMHEFIFLLNVLNKQRVVRVCKRHNLNNVVVINVVVIVNVVVNVINVSDRVSSIVLIVLFQSYWYYRIVLTVLVLSYCYYLAIHTC